jgi:transposase
VIGLRGELKVLVASRPIDFRRGVHGLVAMVAQALGADSYCGNVFVFRSKRKDRLKMVVWDGTGMVLVTKWVSLRRGIQLPTFPATPISTPIAISVSRESPRQITMFPGGGSLARARWPPSLASFVR